MKKLADRVALRNTSKLLEQKHEKGEEAAFLEARTAIKLEHPIEGDAKLWAAYKERKLAKLRQQSLVKIEPPDQPKQPQQPVVKIEPPDQPSVSKPSATSHTGQGPLVCQKDTKGNLHFKPRTAAAPAASAACLPQGLTEPTPKAEPTPTEPPPQQLDPYAAAAVEAMKLKVAGKKGPAGPPKLTNEQKAIMRRPANAPGADASGKATLKRPASAKGSGKGKTAQPKTGKHGKWVTQLYISPTGVL